MADSCRNAACSIQGLNCGDPSFECMLKDIDLSDAEPGEMYDSRPSVRTAWHRLHRDAHPLMLRELAIGSSSLQSGTICFAGV
jgi:hypothetical protein